MRTQSSTRRALVVLVTLGLVAGVAACGRERESPEPPTGPPGAYQEPPRDLCQHVQFEDALQRWGLTVPSWADPANAYEVTERWVNARCRFSAVAEDERFATVFGDFETNGAVELKVFPDAADAVDEYDRLVGGRLEPRAEQVPAATTAEVTGWWDSGVRLELPEVLDPDAYTLGDFEVTSVAVEWVVRHDNLVAESYGTGLAPTDDVGEAAVLLHEVIAAMLNEAARLLSRTG